LRAPTDFVFVLITSSFHRTLLGAGQTRPRLKVQKSHPVWTDADARHPRIEASGFLEESLCLFLAPCLAVIGDIL
jgi:hypothetical protein